MNSKHAKVALGLQGLWLLCETGYFSPHLVVGLGCVLAQAKVEYVAVYAYGTLRSALVTVGTQNLWSGGDEGVLSLEWKSCPETEKPPSGGEGSSVV